MPTMLSQDDAGRVVYASSFSKTVCPGIRVGYLVGPQAVIKQIQTLATNTYISPNMVAQSIVNQFARSGRMDGAIDDGQERAARPPRRGRHRARARAARGEVRARRRAATSCGSSCPRASTSPSSRRPRPSATCCSSRARTSCSRAAQNTLRLAYSGVTPEQIDEGITQLAEAVRSASASRERHSYGDDPSQYGVLYGEGPRRGAASTAASGRPSTACELMDALCADLVARGWAAWNIEYRRLGNGGGVPETLDDVARRDRPPRRAATSTARGSWRSGTRPAGTSRRGRRRARIRAWR